MSETMTAMEAAVEYARFGLRVFPVLIRDGAADNKGPMPGYGWVALATSKVNEVVEDFTNAEMLWGDDVGVGWALGLDRYLAIDLDVPHTEWPTWASEISGAAALNITKRGTHLIFKFPSGMEPGNTDTKFPTAGWGEVRGKHGYIIIAGPDRPGFNLAEFDHCREFPVPEWLEQYGGGAEAVSTAEVVQFAAEHNDPGSMPNKINGIIAAIDKWQPSWEGDPTHGRHPYAVWLMTAVAEEALAGYYPFADGLRLVKQWWHKVTPPERHKREWNGIVTWAVGRALQKSVVAAVSQDPPTEQSNEGESLDALDDDGITPLNWREAWTADPNMREWMVSDFLPLGRQASLTADAKAGKSDLTLYLVACLAQGIDPWTRQPRDPVKIAYFDFEMTVEDVIERMRSYGYDGSEDWSMLDYYLLPPMQALDTKTGAGQFLDCVSRSGPALVVIDTLMRTVAGDENDAKTFANFYDLVGIAVKRQRITMLRLDHYGKDRSKGTRGSTAKDADVDVIWGMTISGRYSRKLTSRSRVPWVPTTLHLERYADPHARFVPRDLVVDNTPTAGVHELLVVLEGLDIPLTWGRDKARQRLAEHGYTADTNLLAEALRIRKARGPQLYVVPDRSDGDNHVDQ